jgi:hypothetical protein
MSKSRKQASVEAGREAAEQVLATEAPAPEEAARVTEAAANGEPAAEAPKEEGNGKRGKKGIDNVHFEANEEGKKALQAWLETHKGTNKEGRVATVTRDLKAGTEVLIGCGGPQSGAQMTCTALGITVELLDGGGRTKQLANDLSKERARNASMEEMMLAMAGRLPEDHPLRAQVAALHRGEGLAGVQEAAKE